MNDLLGDRAGPALTGPPGSLLMCLDSLRERFKDAVAWLAGGPAARAIAGLVRRLLGAAGDEDDGGTHGVADRRHVRRDECDEDRSHAPHPAAGGQTTLLASLAAGLLAVLCWIGPLASWAGTLL